MAPKRGDDALFTRSIQFTKAQLRRMKEHGERHGLSRARIVRSLSDLLPGAPGSLSPVLRESHRAVSALLEASAGDFEKADVASPAELRALLARIEDAAGRVDPALAERFSAARLGLPVPGAPERG